MRNECKHHKGEYIAKNDKFCKKCHEDLNLSSKMVNRVFRAKYPGKMEQALKNKE